MLEQFDIKTLSWVFCNESAKDFEILSDLYEKLDSSFQDVIFETDYIRFVTNTASLYTDRHRTSVVKG